MSADPEESIAAARAQVAESQARHIQAVERSPEPASSARR